MSKNRPEGETAGGVGREYRSGLAAEAGWIRSGVRVRQDERPTATTARRPDPEFVVPYLRPILALLLLAPALPAAEPARKAENVVVVTLDGFRWQELFGGADE